MTTILKYRIYCTTDSVYRYWFLPDTSVAPTTCPDNSAHSIDSAQTAIIDTISQDTVALNLKSDIFSQLVTAQYTPIIQSTFTGNDINPQLYVQTYRNGGNSTLNEMSITLNLTTTVGSYAFVRSRSVLKYLPGYSIHMSGAARFDTGVAGSNQFFGAYSNTNDILIGYSGTEFVIRYGTRGDIHIVQFQITAAANAVQTATVTLNSIPYSVALTNAGGLVNFTAYELQIGNTYGDLWSTRQIGDSIYFVGTIAEPRNGTYSFSSTGNATATITTLETGLAKTVTSVTQDQWNGSSDLVTTLDPLNMNMYQIEYSWYGSGNIQISAYNGFTRKYDILHQFYFANQQTETSLSNPNLYITYFAESVTSTTVLSPKFIGTFGAFIGNIRAGVLPKYSVVSDKNMSSAVETNLLVVRIRNNWNGIDVKAPSNLRRIYYINEASRTAIFRIYLDPTAVGAGTTTNYTDYNFVDETHGLLIVDTTSTTITGGFLVYTIIVGPSSSESTEFQINEFTIEQDSVFIVTGEIISGAASNLACSIEFEDYL